MSSRCLQKNFRSRRFECFQNTESSSSKEDTLSADLSASISLTPALKTFPNKADIRNLRNPLPMNRKQMLQDDDNFDTVSSDVSRMEGGYNRLPARCKYKPPPTLITECNVINRRPSSFTQPSSNVTTIDVKLNYSIKNSASSQYSRKRTSHHTHGTQTLYRESSAQTTPYLPNMKNKKIELENLEIFKLPTILPSDGPPGLYEVEVLGRARKRSAFMKALKENFRSQINESENVSPTTQKNIMEAFEWEHWMEREEYIQQCQVLRFELVVRMFEKREKKMHESSQSRIELCCNNIATKRKAALRKNEIGYGRQVRRLEMNRRGGFRGWRKENITSQLGDPYSEFYVPQMRYGVNPNRRHYLAERKAFEARIDVLEMKAVDMSLLVCPFAKLKKWSRPKKNRMEVEQNFCSDTNLKKLYEGLTNLRQQSSKQKCLPKCLKEKVSPGDAEAPEELFESEDTLNNVTEEPHDVEEKNKINKPTLRRQVNREMGRSKQPANENRTEELEAMLTEYEGSTIGWLMRFLSDEMNRLQEQRNLHFFTMLAQKERWRREAAEAGLRQKENEMREIYEQIFQHTNEANVKVCSEYFTNLIDVDTKDYAENVATNSISELAKIIDRDIQRWLDSFKSIQNPLNYHVLRYILKDLIFPNVDVVLKRYESELVVGSIINEFLFPHIEKLLECYDISFTVASDMIDRLIDNDLYLFSDDSSVSSGVRQPEREAHDILRKLIRRAVPGRRWMTETERDTNVYIGDLLDDIFNNEKLATPEEPCQDIPLGSQTSYLNLVRKEPTVHDESSDSDSERMTLFMQSILINPYHKTQSKDISAVLQAKSEESVAVEHHPEDMRMSNESKSLEEEKEEGEEEESSTVIPFEETEIPSLKKYSKNKLSDKFTHNFIRELINGFIPVEDGDEQEEINPFTDIEDSEDSSLDAMNNLDIINMVWRDMILAENENNLNYPSEAEAEEEDEFQLIINESELELMNTVAYKSKAETEKKALIQNMIRQGKIKMIRPPRFGEEEDTLDYSVKTFEYDENSLVSTSRNPSEKLITPTEDDTHSNDLEEFTTSSKPVIDVTEESLNEEITNPENNSLKNIDVDKSVILEHELEHKELRTDLENSKNVSSEHGSITNKATAKASLKDASR